MTGEGKLVRACMETKIDHLTPYIREVESPEEYVRLLRGKLLEEVGEVIDALDNPHNHTALLEELGDVLQCVYQLAEAFVHDPECVEEARAAKYGEKGALSVVLAWRQLDE